ncbi:hypothetical protein OJAV_G00107190 [Oryzias javanicus]|uniref:Uncharacterized protein n=1 Tax=Oryzias javanicus TaxID=123683 RepID=A0A3S2MTG1_ORYJA|nr:hypothetical protein OJAV_G00107190 [Oryzias javanicus]
MFPVCVRARSGRSSVAMTMTTGPNRSRQLDPRTEQLLPPVSRGLVGNQPIASVKASRRRLSGECGGCSHLKGAALCRAAGCSVLHRHEEADRRPFPSQTFTP